MLGNNHNSHSQHLDSATFQRPGLKWEHALTGPHVRTDLAEMMHGHGMAYLKPRFVRSPSRWRTWKSSWTR
jgi:hypothetical protein